MINIALLGFGTVGHACYQILQERKGLLDDQLEDSFQVKRILVRDIEKYRQEEAVNLMTTDIQEILDDPEINCIIELTGAVEDLIDPIKAAMDKKIHIITANKALVSRYMEELEEAAERNGVLLRFDAAVAGAIPLIESLKKMSLLNEITSIEGVLNGTCNFILSKMEDGKDYHSALQEAQELGFAEADPTADVEGYDTMRKIRICSSIAFRSPVLEEDIDCKGISELKKEAVQKANEEGKRIKLVARAMKSDEGIKVTVAPEPVDQKTILGGLKDGENAVIIRCSNAGTITLKGLGAGGRPTAFAVLSDFLSIYKKD